MPDPDEFGNDAYRDATRGHADIVESAYGKGIVESPVPASEAVEEVQITREEG